MAEVRLVNIKKVYPHQSGKKKKDAPEKKKHNLQITDEGVVAVQQFSLDIADREFIVLVGPTWYDHVDYWVPFDGQIGLHDSSWRDEYGGDIYLTDGSHGCINTPLEAMATIYDHLTVGTIVIVY